jgi:8-oxo-dGTP pyrophosphatase MutT (NUDIX family)
VGLFSEDGEPVVLAVYSAVADGDPVAGDDLTEIGWFPINDLPELAFPRDRRILETWVSDGRRAKQTRVDAAR